MPPQETQFLDRLRDIVGPTAVLTGADMAPYLTDWRGRYTGQAQAVVLPGTTAEVAAVVQVCSAAAVPMVPQGGNTSHCGGATPDSTGQAVVIALGRMRRIRQIDAANGSITVDAGCTLAAVQAAAAEAGRLFPLSLASEGSCQIGGNLSTNAGGVQVLRYGNTRDLTLGLEVVLADGQIWDGLRALRKDNTGYDLKQLFIGAEGTLGIITGAVLKLFPQPASREVLWLTLDSAEQAITVLQAAQQSFGAQLTAFELISAASLRVVLEHIPDSRAPVPPAPWQVLGELSSPSSNADLGERCATFFQQQLAAGHLRDAALARSLAEAKALWRLRESISEAQKIRGFSIKHDISVPVSAIPAFLAEAGQALSAGWPGIEIVAFGHVGDGNLHYNLTMLDPSANAQLIEKTPVINRCVHDLVASFGGSISAEHGLGQLKRDEILRYKSPLEIQLMQQLKQTLDPRGLMNPGKMLVHLQTGTNIRPVLAGDRPVV